MTPSTHRARLAERLLGSPLSDWVNARRDLGKSWEAISRELARETNDGVAYTGEHLRRLFSPPPANGDAA